MSAEKQSIIAATPLGARFMCMRTMGSGLTKASLVLVPPLVGTAAYLATFRDGLQHFLGYAPYIASGSIIWWPFSLFLKKRTFVAGLLGIHAMMVWFLYGMAHWGDDLGWILYLPYSLIGCFAGMAVSGIARKANEWIHRTPR